MVQIHVKPGEEEQQQFLYDCLSTSGIEEIAKDVFEIYTLQTKIQRLVLTLESQLLLLLGDSKGSQPNAAAIPLLRALSEAKAYACKDQLLNKKPLSPHVLRDHIQTIERELLVFQSMGISESIELQQLFSGTTSGSELLQEDTQLWWAGKELTRNKRLCDYIGKNEKTKVFASHIVHALCPPGRPLTSSKSIDGR